MAIELIAKVAPKNDGFTGMVDANQVLGGGGAGTLPDACLAASNVTQHEGSIDHGSIAGLSDDDHTQYIKDSEFTAADEVMVGTGAGTFGQVTLAASQFLAKKAAGAATNVTAGEARTILNVADGADVTGDNTPQVHDHADDAGGGELEIVNDLSPQLGADLDLNTHSLLGDGDTEIIPAWITDESVLFDHCRNLVIQKDEVDGYTGGPYLRLFAVGPTNGGTMIGYRTRGTVASPDPCQNGDVLFRFNSGGLTTTTNKYRGTIECKVDGVVGAGSLPTKISFLTGSSGSRAERMRIQSNGSIYIVSSLGLYFGSETNLIRNYTGHLSLYGTTNIQFRLGGALWADLNATSLTFRPTDQVSLNYAIAGTLKIKSGVNERITINATGLSFNGQAAIARPNYTVTNKINDRALDCNGTLDGVADVLGTLIDDLIRYGLLQ